jgi:ABC-type transporter Mla MlaB component
VEPVRLHISGPIDGTRRPGLMALVWPLKELGLDSCVISVEEIRTIDGEGAAVLIEMLQSFPTDETKGRLILALVDNDIFNQASSGWIMPGG